MNKEHTCKNQDELSAQTQTTIDTYGLQVIMVSASDYSPSFAYSIGLSETYGHPEVICFGLSDKNAHIIINDIANFIKQGEVIQTYTDYDNIFENTRAAFLPVDDRNMNDYFGAALTYYGKNRFTALQLVWTDANNRFPWEEGFEESLVYCQPLLDRNADFKFREPRNLGIFTTRQWLDFGKPILRVVHDYEGDWQFLTGDQLPDDIRLVALEQMVRKDGTLNEVFDLDYGFCMDRDSIGGAWKTSKLSAEDEE